MSRENRSWRPCSECGEKGEGVLVPVWETGPKNGNGPPHFFACTECYSLIPFQDQMEHPRYMYNGFTTRVENYGIRVVEEREADL